MEKKPSNEKPPEKKPAPQSSNLVWYMLGLGVLLLLMITVFRSTDEQEIKWGELVQLIEASNPEATASDSPPAAPAGVTPATQREVTTETGGAVSSEAGATEDDSSAPGPQAADDQPGTDTQPSDQDQEGPAAEGQGATEPVPDADGPSSQPDSLSDEQAALDVATGTTSSSSSSRPPSPDPNQGYIDIPETVGGRQRWVRLWLADEPRIVIGESDVTGYVNRRYHAENNASEGVVDRQPTGGPLGQVERNVKFRTWHNRGQEAIQTLLEQNHISDYDGKPPQSALLDYLPLLIFMILLGVMLIVMLRRMGGAGSPMAFGRSRGKLYAQEDIEVDFDDVAGIEEAVDELREVVEFLKTPEKYQMLGGRIPKGVLLVGPPGTGKTLLAKAVAGEASVPFFSLSGSDFVEMFVGVGAARVRDMFQQAEQKAPCIVFIDELDALGKTRGSGNIGGHDEREQTLNALLVEMDGFGTNSGVIIMAATNRPETLDPALLRPGRFDRHVLVDRPDVAGRAEIIEVHLQNIKVDADVNVKSLAAITSGFVGADLANMVNEAALLAARKGRKAVKMEDFNEAVERSSAGLEKKSRIMHDDEKLRVAYHEAGHALVAYSLPNTDPVHKVSIIPRGLAALGYTMQRPEQDRFLMTQSELESRIQVLLAGTVAEEMIFDDVSSGAQNDLERATEIARSMVMDFGMSRLGRVNYRESNRSPFLATAMEGGRFQSHSEATAREIDQEVKRIVDEGLERTRQILETRRAALVAVSEELIKQEVIDSEQLGTIIDKNSPSAQIVPGTVSEPKHVESKHVVETPPFAPEKPEAESAGG